MDVGTAMWMLGLLVAAGAAAAMVWGWYPAAIVAGAVLVVEGLVLDLTGRGDR